MWLAFPIRGEVGALLGPPESISYLEGCSLDPRPVSTQVLKPPCGKDNWSLGLCLGRSKEFRNKAEVPWPVL